MKIASLVKSIVLSVNERSFSDRQVLKVGDRLVGRVLELKESGRAFMDFGRFRAMADVGFPVRQGDVIHVKVMDENAPLRLGLCGPEPEIGGKPDKILVLGEFPPRSLITELQSEIKRFLHAADGENRDNPRSPELTNTVRNLISHFEPIDLGKDISQIAGQLRKLIEQSGIFYEKNLEKMMESFMRERSALPAQVLSEIPEMGTVVGRDLKANLLALKAFLEAREPILKMLGTKDSEGLRKTVEKFLTDITARQKNGGVRSTTSEPVQVYSYLLPMKESETDAKIKIYYSKKKRATSSEGIRVSLLLDMEKLGQIRTDFFLKGRSLAVDFSVSESPVKDYVDGRLDGLKTVLEGIFEKVSINVLVSEKKVSEFDLEDLTSLGTGLIDIKV